MTTSENTSTVNVDQLPELPEGFHWEISTMPSQQDENIIKTHLWLRETQEDPRLSKVVAWANITKGSKWVQNPTLQDLTIHAEGLLAKTSTRWALGLPTELEAPDTTA